MTQCFINEDTGASLSYKQIPNAKGAIIICPGGGYQFLSPRESEPVADAFCSAGWQAFVLRYSVGENLGKKPLKELAWAVREVRIRAAEMGFEGKPVIVCGFSAGGHLAASLGVHWNDDTTFGPMTIHRPDGLILCYPVITTGKYGHKESIEALAGKNDASYFSLEHFISEHTPPTFLWHTMNDETVPVQNVILFAQGLATYGIPAEVHLYPNGVHGLSLATEAVAEPEKGRLPDNHVAGWFEQCIQWLDTIKLVKEKYL
ncbi:acetyl esterase/lipase [Anaerosolibacter carboniphilus]|uniref:Acetyl esterase/lipase n=1 Tax=Anaerosolibacter carboniphilus TaxID=1417629 RepID=A0A841KNE8_9FIRM|nr:alpha/beta hydrolase [Anaerosolibacter carboniphilus]MBB6215324.1 acetyl esterase/lipase [Anaerosolibacter carboniphilus]